VRIAALPANLCATSPFVYPFPSSVTPTHRHSDTIEYKYDVNTGHNTTRYSSGSFLRPNSCFSSDAGQLGPELDYPIFAEAPIQSFSCATARCVMHALTLNLLLLSCACVDTCSHSHSIGPDGTKGSWFVAAPKHVTVNGAHCYEAWANATYYQEQGNFNELAQYSDDGICPECSWWWW
jgi:hypothetical protein